MKIVAVLQLYNELEQGNLIRCLDNCKLWSDDIIIYDDCSTDDSAEVYLKYTDKDLIIFGNKRDFKNELLHKEQLLNKAITLNPTWIGNIDGDEVFDKFLTENMKSFLETLPDPEIDLIRIHELNLWKDECWYRRGCRFNRVYKSPLWRNTGKLYYRVTGGLHNRQYPKGTRKTLQVGNKLIHYGFSSREKIIYKYFLYKEHGQCGYDLDMIIDEQSSFWVDKVKKKHYPNGLVPINWETSQPPFAETYDEIRNINTYEEYIRGIK